MALTTATKVRQVSFLITSDLIDDSTLETLIETHIDWQIIDALGGTGVFPFTDNTDAPASIQSIAAVLGAAWVIRDRLTQKADVAGIVTALEQWAYDMLEKIRTGKFAVAGFSAQRKYSVQTKPTEVQSGTAFIGPEETDWEETDLTEAT